MRRPNAFPAIYLSHLIHPTKLYDTRPKENKVWTAYAIEPIKQLQESGQITKCMQTIERPKLSRSFETHQGYMYIGVSSFISESNRQMPLRLSFHMPKPNSKQKTSLLCPLLLVAVVCVRFICQRKSTLLQRRLCKHNSMYAGSSSTSDPDLISSSFVPTTPITPLKSNRSSLLHIVMLSYLEHCDFVTHS
jgi:hypothetical protein